MHPLEAPAEQIDELLAGERARLRTSFWVGLMGWGAMVTGLILATCGVVGFQAGARADEPVDLALGWHRFRGWWDPEAEPLAIMFGVASLVAATVLVLGLTRSTEPGLSAADVVSREALDRGANFLAFMTATWLAYSAAAYGFTSGSTAFAGATALALAVFLIFIQSTVGLRGSAWAASLQANRAAARRGREFLATWAQFSGTTDGGTTRQRAPWIAGAGLTMVAISAAPVIVWGISRGYPLASIAWWATACSALVGAGSVRLAYLPTLTVAEFVRRPRWWLPRTACLLTGAALLAPGFVLLSWDRTLGIAMLVGAAGAEWLFWRQRRSIWLILAAGSLLRYRVALADSSSEWAAARLRGATLGVGIYPTDPRANRG